MKINAQIVGKKIVITVPDNTGEVITLTVKQAESVALTLQAMVKKIKKGK